MFCQNCGYEIASSANFCGNCGCKIGNSIAKCAESENTDFDNQAMSIYLSNVLSLECMKKKLKSKWNSFNSELENRKNTGYCVNYQTKEDWAGHPQGGHWVWFKYDGKKIYVALHAYKDDGNGWINENYRLMSPFKSEKLVWKSVESDFYYFNNKKNWLTKTTCPTKEKKQVRDKFLEYYELFKRNARSGYENYLKENNRLMNCKKEVYYEYKKVEELLESAYNINIIPKMFRNMEAVYFLNDFISSSGETFTTALLHCDLDAIKQKLDIIIKNQEDIIIGQAILAAQNRELINQNQQTLSRLANIETNTSRAAQYAQIASNNAEACAWIGMANYIKN